jgi:putative ABC transport system substrate-binding protein
MRRREFIGYLGATAAVWPLAARAQQERRQRHIGVLIGLGANDPEGRKWADALLTSLNTLGWKQGENIRIDLWWGGSDVGRIDTSAKELVSSNPEVIAASTTPAVAALLADCNRADRAVEAHQSRR